MGRGTDLLKTYYGFFNEIMPSYVEGYVPPNTPFPYLTYQVIDNENLVNSIQQIRMWTKSSSMMELAGYIDKLEDSIGHGLVLKVENGGEILLTKGSPFMQLVADEDINIKSALLNIQLYICK